MKKSTILLVIFIVIDVIASYFTSILGVSIMRNSGAIILIKDLIGMWLIPLVLYTLLAISVWAVICDKYKFD